MEKLDFKPITENSNLVSSSILTLSHSFKNVLVAEIDPLFMGGQELCKHYEIDPSEGANCIIIEAIKDGSSDFAAVVIPVGYRADLNGLVRKLLRAKRVSLAPLNIVLAETEMEYGSISPFGLPPSWKILVDSQLLNKKAIIIGSGKQKSKILLPTEIFRNLPNVDIIDGLSKITE